MSIKGLRLRGDADTWKERLSLMPTKQPDEGHSRWRQQYTNSGCYVILLWTSINKSSRLSVYVVLA